MTDGDKHRDNDMKHTARTLVWMTLFLLGVGAVCALLFQPLRDAFLANRIFNGMILGVFVLGIIVNYRQVIAVMPASAWIKRFRQGDAADQHPPAMLVPMATLLTGRRGESKLSPLSMRSLLDGIRSRLDESRDVSRYIIGLLIFLGLLGTFWGLLETLASVGNVIEGLSVEGDDVGAAFDELKAGLRQPLHGMGVAFSSSLFGLAGSLILGFLDLQASHAQNRFYKDLEEWLSELTQLSGGMLTGEGDQPLSFYTETLLEQTAENLDKLQRVMARSNEERHAANNQILTLAENVVALTEQLRGEKRLLLGLARNQGDLQPVLSSLLDVMSSNWSMDAETRQHISNTDVTLTRLAEELSANRNQLVEELRGEIRLLGRALARLPEAKADGHMKDG
jgi:hypothetical protein